VVRWHSILLFLIGSQHRYYTQQIDGKRLTLRAREMQSEGYNNLEMVDSHFSIV